MIHNPHALPLFRDQPSRKRQREKILKDPVKSHKPELPITGPGHGGRIGTSQGSLLTQYLLKAMVFSILNFSSCLCCLKFIYAVNCQANETNWHFITLQQGGLIKETWMEEDPREAILKYADVAAKDPKFIAPAYAQTQPEPVFAKSDSEEEDK